MFYKILITVFIFCASLSAMNDASYHQSQSSLFGRLATYHGAQAAGARSWRPWTPADRVAYEKALVTIAVAMTVIGLWMWKANRAITQAPAVQ